MKILGAEWANKFNLLRIECECGNVNIHPANRVTILCKKCKRIENLHELREKELTDGKSNPEL